MAKTLKKGDGLYGVQHLASKAPDKTKTWAVVNLETGDINGRWHATEQSAKDQLKAMYASMGDKALKMSEEGMSYFVPVGSLAFSEGVWIEGNRKWIKVVPYDSWDHPMFGETVVTRENALEMKTNFDRGVLGVNAHTDYEHGLDPTKGKKASGKYLELDVRDDGLWGLVEFTPEAVKEIDDGEWNYFSPMFNNDKYPFEHPHTKDKIPWVVRGGGVTNQPWIKGMPPLNFSELAVSVSKTAKADVYTAPVGLPDSAYLYVAPDGSRRDLPVKDARGRVVPALLSAARTGAQVLDLPQATRDRLVKAAGRLAAAPLAFSDIIVEGDTAYIPVTEHEGYEKVQRSDGVLIVTDESADKYFREPGVDADLPDINRDDAADDGWRVETPPIAKDDPEDSVDTDTAHMGDENDLDQGGDKVDEGKLREVFGIADDVDIVAHAEKLTADAASLAELRSATEKALAFSEQFPEEYKRMQRLEESNRKADALAFSESYAGKRLAVDTGETEGDGDDATAKLKTLEYGLSGKAVEKIRETYLQFSEGAASPTILREALDTVFNGGLVEYGTRGSSLNDPNVDKDDGVIEGDPVLVFSEAIAKAQENDGLDYEAAMRLVAVQNPKLVEEWQSATRAKS